MAREASEGLLSAQRYMVKKWNSKFEVFYYYYYRRSKEFALTNVEPILENRIACSIIFISLSYSNRTTFLNWTRRERFRQLWKIKKWFLLFIVWLIDRFSKNIPLASFIEYLPRWFNIAAKEKERRTVNNISLNWKLPFYWPTDLAIRQSFPTRESFRNESRIILDCAAQTLPIPKLTTFPNL